MYTLRKVSEHQVYNESLGSAYSVVDKRFNKKDFEHYTKSTFGQDYKQEVVEDVIMYIVTSYVIPIYKTDSCYVMTESGKTFECINNARE